jgi:hypothetical protein
MLSPMIANAADLGSEEITSTPLMKYQCSAADAELSVAARVWSKHEIARCTASRMSGYVVSRLPLSEINAHGENAVLWHVQLERV